MPRSRPPYAPEFRRQMVELVRAGRSPEELSREFEPTAQAIRNWVVQAERDEGRRGDGPVDEDVLVVPFDGIGKATFDGRPERVPTTFV